MFSGGKRRTRGLVCSWLTIVVPTLVLAGVAIGMAYASDVVTAPPPPAGPEPSRWYPASSGVYDESDLAAQRSAYSEDYEAMQAGGGAVAVKAEYEVGEVLPLAELPTGLVDVGRYLPDVSGEYRQGEFFPYADEAQPAMVGSVVVTSRPTRFDAAGFNSGEP